MTEVDARGLSCPEPVMLANDALTASDGPVKVLVSEPHQAQNIEKLAKSKNKKSETKEVDDGFEIVIS